MQVVARPEYLDSNDVFVLLHAARRSLFVWRGTHAPPSLQACPPPAPPTATTTPPCKRTHPGCNLMHARLKQRLQPTEQTGCLVS